ncbi:PHD finger-containing protein 5-like [Miscanthus floridulus]|uniref:PHD finger-containing protein 5-like n=1 Tax=Miscanthus floridulus TaxID=154761 RepID=UPI003457A389
MAGGPNVAGLIEDDAVSVITEGLVVCEICGSGSAPHLIANCARCSAREHWYCMQVLTFLIPRIWFCNRCQRKANRAPRS